MISLVFAAPALEKLREALLDPKLESGGIVLATPVERDGNLRLLVRDVHVASDSDYAERTAVSVTLASSFCLPLEKKAKTDELSLVYCHTHPFAKHASFSNVDDECERELSVYLAGRGIGAPHAALLFANEGLMCRRLGTNEEVAVIEVGPTVRDSRAIKESNAGDEAFARQILAFGPIGQARIAAATVGIVGLGGTGSTVVQQLAHLGVSRFILIDDDTVEASNLNRLVGAEASDAGRTSKTEVAARLIRGLRPDADIELIRGDVTDAAVADKLVLADVIFSCTDTHASRHLLNQLAYQYLVPVIDMGVAITVTRERVQFSGHTKMLAPRLPCLWCTNNLDPAQVRQELMTDEQRAADPYVQGGPGVAQPAVISLNGVVSSMAITMFLSAFAGVPSAPRYVTYDGNRARVNPLEAQRNPECVFCGDFAPIGYGDRAPLPTRA